MAVPGPHLFIIGAMKSGTSSLFDYLAGHPQICASRIKEPGFFAFDDALDLGLAWYRELWDWRPDLHRYALEGSTYYSKMPAVPDVTGTIAEQIGTEHRFIYLVRHPLRRAESQVRHVVFGRYHVRNPDLHAPADLHVTPEKSLAHGLSPHLIDFSRYAYQLDPFVARFGRERILVLAMEQMIADPPSALRRICRFLDIDKDAIELNTDKVVNRGKRGIESKLWSRLNSVRALRDVYVSVVPEALRRHVREAMSDTSHRDLRLRLNEDEADRILTELRPDLRRLRDEWDIDVEGLWDIDL